jgi:hypothetical protein
MAKKSGKTRGTKKAAARRAGAGKRASKRRSAGARGSKQGAAHKQARSSAKTARPKKTAARSAVPARKKPAAKAAPARRTAPKRPSAGPSTKLRARPSTRIRAGGTGREETLAQTPETGRTRRGPTNPMPTRRSTGTAAGAGTIKSPRLERARRQLREIEESVPTPPSSLDIDRRGPSAARSGRQHLEDTKADHPETSPVMTSGDVDADWEDAYSVGDEAPGGDNPTPDQDRVDEIGKALGVTYDDNEELKASDKIADRDKHRWELDPASSEDYTDRD